MADDLKSPTGVFGLTDAGGRLADPGALLPYDEQPGFTVSGEGFFGEPLEGSFDYVVAINYNREPGTTPLDRTRPMGEERGGGIWIHVDHGGPTQGCVSLPENRMRQLLTLFRSGDRDGGRGDARRVTARGRTRTHRGPGPVGDGPGPLRVRTNG